MKAHSNVFFIAVTRLSQVDSDLEEMEDRLREMFHKLWGASLQQHYDKREWENFQQGLERYFEEAKKPRA